MKMFVALAALLLSASCVLAGAPRFTSCGDGNDLLTDVVYTTDTPNWRASSTVHFTISGNLKSGVSAGSIKTLAYFDGMKAEEKTDDLCTYDASPFNCPLAAGANSWTFPFAIPSVPWPGTLESSSDFKVTAGGRMFCMNLAVDL